MKNLICTFTALSLFVSTALFSNSAFAAPNETNNSKMEPTLKVLGSIDLSPIFCEEAYEKKFAQIDKHHKARKHGYTYVLIGGIAAGTALGIVAAGGAGIFLASIPFMGGYGLLSLGGGVGASELFKKAIDREKYLHEAHELIATSLIPVTTLHTLGRPLTKIDSVIDMLTEWHYGTFDHSDESYEKVRLAILSRAKNGNSFCPVTRFGNTHLATWAQVFRKVSKDLR